MAAAASGQALTKNQKKKLKKKLKKAGAGSQATDSGQLPEASHTDSDGSCGTGERLPKMLLHALQHQAHRCSTYRARLEVQLLECQGDAYTGCVDKVH